MDSLTHAHAQPDCLLPPARNRHQRYYNQPAGDLIYISTTELMEDQHFISLLCCNCRCSKVFNAVLLAHHVLNAVLMCHPVVYSVPDRHQSFAGEFV